MPPSSSVPARARRRPDSTSTSSSRPDPGRPATPRISPSCSSMSRSEKRAPSPRTFAATATGPARASRALGEHLTQLAADHEPDELAVAGGVDAVESADVAAIAEDRHAVAQLGDLGQVVRDVETGHPLLPEPPDGREDASDLLGRQWRRRFVEHDQRGTFVDERPGDLHQLTLGWTEVADEGAGIELRTQLIGQEPGGPAAHLPTAKAQDAALLVAHEHRLRHREAGHEVELLVDEADAELVDRVWRWCGERLAVDDDPPGVREMDAGEDLDDGGLARTVLADEAMHLAGAHLERRVTERLDPREPLVDPGHVEYRVALRRPSPSGIGRLRLRTDAGDDPGVGAQSDATGRIPAPGRPPLAPSGPSTGNTSR